MASTVLEKESGRGEWGATDISLGGNNVACETDGDSTVATCYKSDCDTARLANGGTYSMHEQL
jgi:hypothetical protein